MKLNTMSILDHEIDALVDNELAETPRRELLLRLEQQPDQWRRVALAFLEAQSFATSFTPLNREPALIVTPRKEVAEQHAPFLRRYSWKNLVILTACMLMAFLLGLATVRTNADKPDAHLKTSNEQQHLLADLSATKHPLVLAHSLSIEAKQELERRGFQVLEQPRLVHIDIKGQSVPVFFHQITVRFVGSRSLL